MSKKKTLATSCVTISAPYIKIALTYGDKEFIRMTEIIQVVPIGYSKKFIYFDFSDIHRILIE